MTTGILVALTIVVVLAAASAGVLLLRRRPRPAPPAEAENPRTVGDLVRQRTEPSAADLSGHDLFAPTGPQRVVQAAPASPASADRDADPDAEARTVEVPLPQPALTAPADAEAGDAPWRRAARMRGEEPGAGWDTAPLPVVAAASAGPAPATAGAEPMPGRPDADGSTVGEPTGEPTEVAADVVEPAADGPAVVEPADEPAELPAPHDEAGVEPADEPAVLPGPPDEHADGQATREPVTPEPVVSTGSTRGPREGEPAAVRPPTERAPSERVTQPVRLEPVPAARRPTPAPRTGPVPARTAEGASVWTLPEDVATGPATPAVPAHRTDGPSRPLSDPEMTPLMGIPIVRPLAAAEPAAPPPPPVPVADEVTAPRPLPGVPPAARAADDEVVWMVPAPGSEPPPPVRTGSPQPLWFRVVRRDGEPVAGAVVALLDDHGQEVDTTKTATDGGGELRAPHGGRFLMIASADGFQPRAVLLTVEERPVELALLLPRSASVTGAVRSEDRLVAGARVVVRQEGEIVDDLVTGRDGAYRFNELAEGGYVLSATDHRGSVVRQVTVSEGADVQLDLVLVYREGAR